MYPVLIDLRIVFLLIYMFLYLSMLLHPVADKHSVDWFAYFFSCLFVCFLDCLRFDIFVVVSVE